MFFLNCRCENSIFVLIDTKINRYISHFTWRALTPPPFLILKNKIGFLFNPAGGFNPVGPYTNPGGTNLTLTYVVIFLWGVAVLKLDSHPDHNKGLDLRTLYKS